MLQTPTSSVLDGACSPFMLKPSLHNTGHIQSSTHGSLCVLIITFPLKCLLSPMKLRQGSMQVMDPHPTPTYYSACLRPTEPGRLHPLEIELCRTRAVHNLSSTTSSSNPRPAWNRADLIGQLTLGDRVDRACFGLGCGSRPAA